MTNTHEVVKSFGSLDLEILSKDCFNKISSGYISMQDVSTWKRRGYFATDEYNHGDEAQIATLRTCIAKIESTMRSHHDDEETISLWIGIITHEVDNLESFLLSVDVTREFNYVYLPVDSNL